MTKRSGWHLEDIIGIDINPDVTPHVTPELDSTEKLTSESSTEPVFELRIELKGSSTKFLQYMVGRRALVGAA